MRILVVGGGGREHAMVWRLAQNPTVDRLFAAPGNAGIGREATRLPVKADDVRGIVAAVEREGIDLTVVGPEGPLVGGLADELEARGHPVFGPTKDAARIEGSKAWAKELCDRHAIPSGRSRSFTKMQPAIDFVDELGGGPVVIKADGLAAGKGVTVAADRAAAVVALEASLVDHVFGDAGTRVLVEEFLEGPEVSAFALTDGRDVLPLALAQDFKRVGDDDAGPNTGGMGAYSPLPWLDDEAETRIWELVSATARALRVDRIEYSGLLYAGLMLAAEGPKVLEYNCRFGDPETEAVLPRLQSDLAAVLAACAADRLDDVKVGLSQDAAVTVVLASGGYPGPYETGRPITGLEAAATVPGAVVFHAGTTERDGRVFTAGGRVLAVTGWGRTVAEARARAYEAASAISFDGMTLRDDIAAEAGGLGAQAASGASVAPR